MKAYAKTNTSDSPSSNDTSSNITVNSFRGYFYNSEGEFLSHEGEAEDVYSAEKYTTKGTTFIYEDVTNLNITHADFCYIAGVLYNEDHSTFEGSAAVTQTTFNAVKLMKGNISMKEQARWAKKLLATDYSSTSKRSLPDTKQNQGFMTSRKGLIHVLKGGYDYSHGALLWDGVDFAAKGSRHVKANAGGGIEITEELWNQFIDVTSESDLIKGYGQTRDEARKNIKFYEAETKPTWKILYDIEKKNALPKEYYAAGIALYGNSYFTAFSGSAYWIKDGIYYRQTIVKKNPFISLGTGKYNKGCCLNKAVVVHGRQIYWAANKEYPNNKEYQWKYFLGTL